MDCSTGTSCELAQTGTYKVVVGDNVYGNYVGPYDIHFEGPPQPAPDDLDGDGVKDSVDNCPSIPNNRTW